MRPLILILCICIAMATRGEAGGHLWSCDSPAKTEAMD